MHWVKYAKKQQPLDWICEHTECTRFCVFYVFTAANVLSVYLI